MEPLSSGEEISSFSIKRIAFGSDRKYETNPAVPETKQDSSPLDRQMLFRFCLAVLVPKTMGPPNALIPSLLDGVILPNGLLERSKKKLISEAGSHRICFRHSIRRKKKSLELRGMLLLPSVRFKRMFYDLFS